VVFCLLADYFQTVVSSARTLRDGVKLPPPFPHAGQGLPQFLVRDVEVTLRGLDVGVPEHQLNDPDIDALREQAAGAFVAQVVPVQVDLP
jgi:hypothetical protein